MDNNKKNMRADLLDAKADPGRSSARRMSGMTALAYNRDATGRDIPPRSTTLWDPAKGKIQPAGRHPGRARHDHAVAGRVGGEPDPGYVQKAVGLIKEQKDKGQIRRFTGNDYADDLASGNVVIAQAYSGDVVRLQKDNPDLKFVVRDRRHDVRRHHGHPLTTQNQKAAEGGSTTSTTGRTTPSSSRTPRYVPVLSDMSDELNKIDPKASNPLINPPKETLDKLKTWAALTDEQTQEFNKGLRDRHRRLTDGRSA